MIKENCQFFPAQLIRNIYTRQIENYFNVEFTAWKKFQNINNKIVLYSPDLILPILQDVSVHFDYSYSFSKLFNYHIGSLNNNLHGAFLDGNRNAKPAQIRKPYLGVSASSCKMTF